MTTIAERMLELRCALDPEDGTTPVSYRTIDRCVGAANRWARMEGRPDAKQRRETVRKTVRAVLSKLSATAQEAACALAYVECGAGALPWTKDAPARWKQPSPVERIGRERGTKVVGARIVKPGEPAPPPPRVDLAGAMTAVMATAAELARGAIDLDRFRDALRASLTGAVASAGFIASASGSDIWELLQRGVL